MSHDQRPGKMRVVGAQTQSPKRRRGDAVTIEGVAETVPGTATSAQASTVAAPAGLPLMPALLFLLACIGGGVAVALFAPLGHG